MQNNNKYNLVAENPQSTVVGEYVVDGVRVAQYQSEADLERAFIKQLLNFFWNAFCAIFIENSL